MGSLDTNGVVLTISRLAHTYSLSYTAPLSAFQALCITLALCAAAPARRAPICTARIHAYRVAHDSTPTLSPPLASLRRRFHNTEARGKEYRM